MRRYVLLLLSAVMVFGFSTVDVRADRHSDCRKLDDLDADLDDEEEIKKAQGACFELIERGEKESVEARAEAYKILADFWLFENPKWVIKALNAALKLKPNDPELFQTLGWAYGDVADEASGKERKVFQSKAIESFNKSIELNPIKSALYSNRAGYYRNIGKLENALSDYARAIELKPHSEYYRQRGQVYQKIEQKDKAIADFKKGLELHMREGGNGAWFKQTLKELGVNP